MKAGTPQIPMSRTHKLQPQAMSYFCYYHTKNNSNHTNITLQYHTNIVLYKYYFYYLLLLLPLIILIGLLIVLVGLSYDFYYLSL